MQGVVRFTLFIAIVILVVGGIYANGFRQTVAKQQATITALTAERDAAKAQAEISNKQTAENADALKEAQSKISELQSQLDESKKAPRGRR
jgi:uncharacterized protein HemX